MSDGLERAVRITTELREAETSIKATLREARGFLKEFRAEVQEARRYAATDLTASLERSVTNKADALIQQTRADFAQTRKEVEAHVLGAAARAEAWWNDAMDEMHTAMVALRAVTKTLDPGRPQFSSDETRLFSRLMSPKAEARRDALTAADDLEGN